MTFTYSQVQYILQNYVTLSRGVWPDPETVMDCRRPNFNYRAPFEEPVLLAGEISIRLNVCGTDGDMVKKFYGFALPFQLDFDVPGSFVNRLDAVSHLLHRDPDRLRKIINRVTFYLTDKEYATLPYHVWKERRKYRQKEVVR